jgi:hypothetical protein
MLAGRYNMVCDQGSTFQRVLEIKDANGVAFSLVGYTARMQIRRDVDATSSVMELTSANGRISISATLGAITITLTPDLTATLSRSGVYDLEIVKTSTGAVYKVVRGEFRVEKEVTR